VKRALFALFVALPAFSSASERESAIEQLCQSASVEEGCAPVRMPASTGRATPAQRGPAAAPSGPYGSGRVTGSGYFDPMEAGRTGVGTVHVSGDISVRRPDGATGVVRVRGTATVPDTAVDGSSVEVRLVGVGEMTLAGRPAGQERVDIRADIILIVSGHFVRVNQVVSFGNAPKPFNCEEEPAVENDEHVP
jgi:hypothetical protein